MRRARQTNIFEPVRCASDRHKNLAAIINRIRKVDISALEHSQLRLRRVGRIFNEFDHAAIIQMFEVDFHARGDRRRRRLDHPQEWFFFGALDAAMNIVRFWFLMQTLACHDVYSKSPNGETNTIWSNNYLRVIILCSFPRPARCLGKKIGRQKTASRPYYFGCSQLPKSNSSVAHSSQSSKHMNQRTHSVSLKVRSRSFCVMPL